MSAKEIKITVEHEPGCIMLVCVGLLLGTFLGGLRGCVVNIGSDLTTNTPAPAGKQEGCR